MKESTSKLLEIVDECHDWDEGQTRGGGGTRLSQTDVCRVCGLKREWFSDRQNDIGDSYTFESIDGAQISLAAAVKAGCAV